MKVGLTLIIKLTLIEFMKQPLSSTWLLTHCFRMSIVGMLHSAEFRFIRLDVKLITKQSLLSMVRLAITHLMRTLSLHHGRQRCPSQQLGWIGGMPSRSHNSAEPLMGQRICGQPILWNLRLKTNDNIKNTFNKSGSLPSSVHIMVSTASDIDTSLRSPPQIHSPSVRWRRI